MSIKTWHIQEQPREKLLQKGTQALSNAELIAILLGSGTQNHDAMQLAYELLEQLGGIRQLFHANQKQICAFSGVGKAKFALFQTVKELCSRLLLAELAPTKKLLNSQQTKNFLRFHLRDLEQEVFSCLFLTSQYQVIAFEELFQGTVNKAIVHPREVVKKSLEKNAKAVIFAHNHPSGIITPSKADKELTQTLQEALELVEIQVLDHFIIGKNDYYSFAEHGELFNKST